MFPLSKDDDFNNTYFLDITSEVYTPGPDMALHRYGLTCNHISSTNEIIMVGGAKIKANDSCTITYRKDVEILNLDSGTIRKGEWHLVDKVHEAFDQKDQVWRQIDR